MINLTEKPTFEQSINEIDALLSKRRNKWSLSALGWIDFDDVSQIIRLHIYKKWHLYDHARPLGPWINRVIASQMKNLIRNYYGNYSRPCLKCPANEGNNLCVIYQKQCSDCPMYREWEKSRKNAFDTKLPVSLNYHEQEVYNVPHDSIDVEKSGENLHAKIKTLLKDFEWKIYESLYINNLNEEQTAELMGYKTNEKGRKAGYKHIKKIKKKICGLARKLLYSGEVDIV